MKGALRLEGGNVRVAAGAGDVLGRVAAFVRYKRKGCKAGEFGDLRAASCEWARSHNADL